jgi:hypothetical protein
LVEQLCEVRRRRKLALREAKERCRAERIAARERARAMRPRVLEELREAMRAERLDARARRARRASLTAPPYRWPRPRHPLAIALFARR